jgi:signal transduction histidine kinase
MTATPARLERWGRRLGLETLDLWFAGLRAATFAAGLAWWALEPASTRAPQGPALGMFFVFSAGLYLLNTIHPGRLAILYRIALVFDVSVVFFLTRVTGGFSSEIYLGFALLIAIHAFYFGLVTGLATAVGSSALYTLAGDWPLPMPAFALRIGFFLMVGLCMGLLSETARKQREALEQRQEQIMRSDRLATVGELAAGLAHELRNPLAGMAGALRVLGSQLAPQDERLAILADVQAQIARMNKTLTDLLQQTRPAKQERAPVDVNALLEQSLRFMPRGSVEIARHFDPSLPMLQVDSNLLHQAFLNIVVNARQAMPHGGRLTLRTRLHERTRPVVEVVISDTGLGIAPEEVGRIFQPFFTTKPQGTGLGLAIAARIIEQHGGRITVDSTPTVGTSFTIALPVGPAAERLRRDQYAFESAGR